MNDFIANAVVTILSVVAVCGFAGLGGYVVYNTAKGSKRR